MQSVGQAWLVLELTNSPFKLGLVSTFQFGPFLVFSFFAGALVDRLPKRRMIITTQSVLLVQAATLTALVWGGHVQYWHVAVLASVYGLANTFDMPARQAFIVEMVGKADLMNAITLSSASFNAARVLGPALAGLLIARFGVALAFGINALSFVAVIVALLTIRTEGPPRTRSGTSLLDDILEGVSYAGRTPRVLLVLSLLFGVGLFVFNYNVVVPLLARGVLQQDAEGFGVLMAMLGGGALLGAVTLAALGLSRPPVWLLAASAALVSAAMLTLRFVHDFWLAAAILLVMGYAGILFMTGCNTVVQLAVPDQLRGRVMSLYMFVFVGVTPVGSFFVGTIAEHFGPRAAFMASGALGLAAVIVVMAWWKLRRRGQSGWNRAVSSHSREPEEARRAARASWPIVRFKLGEEPPDDISDVTTPEERIAMMWPLAVEAWRLAGRPLPDYDRGNIPTRLFRPGERPPDDDDP